MLQDIPYISFYDSPLGKIIISADEIGLTGLQFFEQKNFNPSYINPDNENIIPVFSETKKWLDIYFNGIEPNFIPKIHQTGTQFRMDVWEILKTIPYGKTVTYKDISKKVAYKRNQKSMSPQAIGSAVGKNNILIIIPCHRVIGSDGSLTGYAAGIKRKEQLIELEKHSEFQKISAAHLP